MDIIVTIPKSEYKNIKLEDQVLQKYGGKAVQFWSVGRKPKNLNVGDRVYFVEKGAITCYQTFLGYVSNPICEVTNRLWSGLNLLLECPAIPISNPIPFQGFRGFRYTQRIL